MKILVFTPTNKPGIDVTHASILRQKFDGELTWIVADTLFEDRCHVFVNFAQQNKDVYTYKHFYPQPRPFKKRTLVSSYNLALNYARENDIDLFISLQDYIWVPDDGISKFIEMYNECEIKNNLLGIYSGITSITSDPDDSEVHDTGGMYSIFNQPFYDRPQDLDWMDVRYRHNYEYRWNFIPEIEWETNWACIPRTALYDENLNFDEEYDKGLAYENADFAKQALALGYQPIIDYENQVLSLPHKRYFSDEWENDKPLREENRKRFEAKWPTNDAR